jgi:imidazoleglycerol phosphate synthase glutamine amidotransferase subunit HisH
LALTNVEDIEYPAAVISANIIGTQFHPEKSGEIGLNFLKDTIDNF